MTHIDHFIDVDVPVRTAYDQWTRFEDFPLFMEGVQSVRQLDPSHIRWKARIGGKFVEWVAEIHSQVPDKLIAWRSVDGATNAGTVTFEPLDAGRTRVRLGLDYRTEGFVEGAADALGLVSMRVMSDLARFKAYVEGRGGAPEGWRGEIHADVVEASDASTLRPGEALPA